MDGSEDGSNPFGAGRPGFGDRAILDLILVVAYFGFVNRLASGLGVELEE